MGREEIAEEDMAICEGLFDNESIRRVVIQGIADGGCFSCALCCMIIACGLYYFAQFAICTCETRMGFLDGELANLDT